MPTYSLLSQDVGAPLQRSHLDFECATLHALWIFVWKRAARAAMLSSRKKQVFQTEGTKNEFRVAWVVFKQIHRVCYAYNALRAAAADAFLYAALLRRMCSVGPISPNTRLILADAFGFFLFVCACLVLITCIRLMSVQQEHHENMVPSNQLLWSRMRVRWDCYARGSMRDTCPLRFVRSNAFICARLCTYLSCLITAQIDIAVWLFIAVHVICYASLRTRAMSVIAWISACHPRNGSM